MPLSGTAANRLRASGCAPRGGLYDPDFSIAPGSATSTAPPWLRGNGARPRRYNGVPTAPALWAEPGRRRARLVVETLVSTARILEAPLLAEATPSLPGSLTATFCKWIRGNPLQGDES